MNSRSAAVSLILRHASSVDTIRWDIASWSIRYGLSASAGFRSLRARSAMDATEAINGFSSENIAYCRRSG